MLMLMFLKPVRHRIDGLENSGVWFEKSTLVRHRIDGLENQRDIKVHSHLVRHRIDGLEIS